MFTSELTSLPSAPWRFRQSEPRSHMRAAEFRSDDDEVTWNNARLCEFTPSARRTKNPPFGVSGRDSAIGEGGIRTHGGVTHTGFQDRRLQPLGHLSRLLILFYPAHRDGAKTPLARRVRDADRKPKAASRKHERSRRLPACDLKSQIRDLKSGTQASRRRFVARIRERRYPGRVAGAACAVPPRLSSVRCSLFPTSPLHAPLCCAKSTTITSYAACAPTAMPNPRRRKITDR